MLQIFGPRPLDWKVEPQDAVSRPNFFSNQRTLELENHLDVSEDLVRKMKSYGYNVVRVDNPSGLHVMAKLNGVWTSGVDPRREGLALGL